MSEVRPLCYIPTEEQLAVIAKRYGLGRLESWSALPGGVVNPAVLLNERAVLRINVREPDSSKIVKEAWALAFVASRPSADGWRAPQAIAADTSRTLLPYDYLLLEYLPGRPGEGIWEECDAAERARLSRQMGRALAHLHTIPLPGRGYGDWNPQTGTLGIEEDWRGMVERRNADLLAEAAALQTLPAGQIAAVRDWLAEHFAAVPPMPDRVLIHGDFGLWNAMVEPVGNAASAPPWKVTSIFDFEWAQAGPPALDFVPIFHADGDPVDPVAFLDGYGDARRIGPSLLQEAHYYQMHYHLDLLSVAHRHWGGEGAEWRLQLITQLLRKEPLWGFAAAGYGWPF